MNRTVLAIVVAVLLGGAVVAGLVVFFAVRAADRAAAVPWPYDLGPLSAAPSHFPATERNDAAARLAELLVGERPPGALHDYVRAEAGRGDGTIGPVPDEVKDYLARYVHHFDELRDHLRILGPPVWDHDPAAGFAGPLDYQSYHDLWGSLVARALLRPDAGAWDELQAAWNLGVAMTRRPELYGQGVALMIARCISAVAWRLPLPAPAWFHELDGVAFDRLIVRALQYEAWFYWEHTTPQFSGRLWLVLRPLSSIGVAGLIRHQRETAEALVRVQGCAFDMDAFVAEHRPKQWNVFALGLGGSHGAFWDRVLRYRAEHEATRNALRAAAGEPIVAASRCEGTWSSETLPDGRVRIAYSVELPPTSNGLAAPLVRITPAK